MCGIIGYVGKADATPILLEGLRRLEYRGYDSSGLAVMNGNSDAPIQTRKRSGRLDNLRKLLKENPADGNCGISHTRWATHGEPTDENAHPHHDRSGKLALVHNGVIENYQVLKDQLEEDGHTFHSQTDSEVLAHLVGNAYEVSEEGIRSADLSRRFAKPC
ncbi:MAG: class II glutamine amidotransferase, partial [Verrucomicrobiales bacterium]|nr:class II glutamine amidotransferase [Verrucomicrobiales bacterium]